MQFTTSLLVLATAFLAGASALNIPREPAGCNGGSYRDVDQAKAVAACQANCKDGCIAPFQNGGYWYSVCSCN